MKESTTYQAILEEVEQQAEQKWRVEEAPKLLLRLGSKLLGQPSTRTQTALAKITDLERLETLCERVHTVESWHALLADAVPDRR
jgi:predicted transposase YdaD